MHFEKNVKEVSVIERKSIGSKFGFNMGYIN